MSNAKQSPFVSIRPKDDGIIVNYAFSVLHKETESGKLSCFIPSLNIRFTATEKSVIVKKAKAFSRMYFDQYFLHEKNGLKKLVLELHKLGYKANNDVSTVHKLINNNLVPAKFKVPDRIPKGYSPETQMHSEVEFAM